MSLAPSRRLSYRKSQEDAFFFFSVSLFSFSPYGTDRSLGPSSPLSLTLFCRLPFFSPAIACRPLAVCVRRLQRERRICVLGGFCAVSLSLSAWRCLHLFPALLSALVSLGEAG